MRKMKRIKRWPGVLLAGILGAGSCVSGAAVSGMTIEETAYATDDRDGPVIYSFSLDKTNAKPGDKIKVTAKAG